jgi:hypothetical protein
MREEGGGGRDEGRWSKGECSEIELTTVKMGIYTLKVQILRARSEVSGKPGISGKISVVFAPLSPAIRFARNLILDRFGRLYV